MVREVKMSSIIPGVLGLGDHLYVKGYEIEGLRTKFVAYRERVLDSANVTVVNVEVQPPEHMTVSLNKNCFGVVGRMTIHNLEELLTPELQAKGVRPVAFSADGTVLPENCLFSFINKEHPSKDGFISLVCITQRIGEEEQDAVDREEQDAVDVVY